MCFLTDCQLRIIWGSSFIISVLLLGAAIVLGNSTSPVLRETLFYCIVIGMGLFLFNFFSCFCNRRLKSVLLCQTSNDFPVFPNPPEDYPVASVIFVNNPREIMEATVIEINSPEEVV
jgi:hypothetical protein